MPKLEIYLLGNTRIVWHGELLPAFPTRKARSVFLYLITHRGRSFTRAHVAGSFWGDFPEQRAMKNLNTTLWRIRQVVPEEYIVVENDAVFFDLSKPFWLDVDAFTAKCSVDDLALPEKIAQLTSAVQLYRGDFLEGLYQDWAIVETERLRSIYLQALKELLKACNQTGAFDDALNFGLRYLQRDPFREDVHQQVMRLYARMGRYKAAIHQYQECLRVFESELGIEPSPSTVALYEEILQSPKEPLNDSQLIPKPAPLAASFVVDPFHEDEPIPFAGRRKEREYFLRFLDHIDRDSGSIILIEGEPGVGKTRLLDEITDAARWRGIQAWWGFCRDEPYAPFIDILETSLTPLRLEQLSRFVSDHCLAAVAQLIPSVREQIALPDLPESDLEMARARLHRGLCAVLNGLGQISPFVLIVEDWHAMDDATIDILSELSDCGLPIIGTTRGGELRGQRAVWDFVLALDRQGRLTRFSLERLSEYEVRELLDTLLGVERYLPEFASQIYVKTHGNPLFLIETLKSLVESGALKPDSEGVWISKETEFLKIPDAVSTLLSSRLERLSPESLTLLEAAAVLGTPIDYGVWQQVVEFSDQAILRSSTALLRRQFIFEGDTGYHFRHDLIQQAILDRIDLAKKQNLHNRAGLVLSDMAPDRVGEICRHFHFADNDLQVLSYAIQAGEQAQMIYANQAALTFFTWGIDAGKHLTSEDVLPDLMILYEKRGHVYELIGHYENCVQDYQAVQSIAEQIKDLSSQARSLRRIGWVNGSHLGNYALGIECSQEALKLAKQAEDVREIAMIQKNMGAFLNLMGEQIKAAEVLQQSLKRFISLGDLRGEAGVYQYFAVIYQFQGEDQKALENYRKSLTRWQKLNLQREAAKILSNIGFLSINTSDLQGAYSAFQEAVSILREIGATVSLPWALMGLGTCQYYQGLCQESIESLQEASGINHNCGLNPFVEALIQYHLGYANWYLGKISGCFDHLTQSLDLARMSETPTVVVGSLIALGWFHAQFDHDPESMSLYEEALNLSQEIDFPRGKIKSRQGLVRMQGLITGDRNKLSQLELLLTEAKGISEWIFAKFSVDLAQVYLTLGDCTRGFNLARDAAGILHKTGWTTFSADAHYVWGHCLYGVGQLDQAEDALKTGISFLASGGWPLSKVYLLGVLALVYRDLGRFAESNEMIDQARKTADCLWIEITDVDLQTAFYKKLQKFGEKLGVWLTPLKDGQAYICLARPGFPTGRPLCDNEQVTIIWTVKDVESESGLGGKALRHHRILRLIDQAVQQGGEPTQSDLADALGVTVRTIRSDLQTLRSQGYEIRTRGASS